MWDAWCTVILPINSGVHHITRLKHLQCLGRLRGVMDLLTSKSSRTILLWLLVLLSIGLESWSSESLNWDSSRACRNPMRSTSALSEIWNLRNAWFQRSSSNMFRLFLFATLLIQPWSFTNKTNSWEFSNGVMPQEVVATEGSTFLLILSYNRNWEVSCLKSIVKTTAESVFHLISPCSSPKKLELCFPTFKWARGSWRMDLPVTKLSRLSRHNRPCLDLGS